VIKIFQNICNQKCKIKTTFCNKLVKGKGKAVPLQAWSGTEGSRNLRFPDFLKTAQDGGKVVRLTHRPHVLYKEVKAKQSRYRPGMAQRVPGR
jgi:hypothetical protein